MLAPLLGKPLLWHTLRALAAQIDFFASLPTASLPTATSSTRCSTLDAQIVEFVVAVRDEERAIVQTIFDETQIALPLKLAAGGATRAASVQNCVEKARGDFVLVHDAARPCLTSEVTTRVVAQALRSGAAIAALPADDTVKRVQNESIEETLDRSTIFLAQTPQVFRREWLRNALRNALRDAPESGFVGTDCASYVERYLRKTDTSSTRCRVQIVRGDARNLKVTYADDLARAADFLSSSIANPEL